MVGLQNNNNKNKNNNNNKVFLMIAYALHARDQKCKILKHFSAAHFQLRSTTLYLWFTGNWSLSNTELFTIVSLYLFLDHLTTDKFKEKYFLLPHLFG